jgi:nucleotide-binding universal stress UspA family protein
MKRILIPTDFSDNSKKVCEYAVNMIGTEPAEIELFHILPDSIMMPDSSFPAGIDTDAFLNSEYLDELRRQSQINMAKLKAETLDYIVRKGIGKIKINTNISSGDAEWEIRDACEKFSPEIIVMGTRGSGNKGFLEGSMAEKIMSKVNIPVIAVPENSGNALPKNILYATNFCERDYMKIMLLFTIFKNLDITIFVTHFAFGNDDKTKSTALNNLENSFKEKSSNNKINFNLIDTNDKSVSIRAFCEEYNIDMISFISHKSNIFKNLFSNKIHKKDFFKLNMPMLAMHD